MVEWISNVEGREMVRIACPHCNKLLNCDEEERECRVKVKSGDKEGSVCLSAFWDDYTSREEGIEIADGDEVEMFCPRCDKSLKSDGLCKECDASTTIFSFSNSHIAICNRKGCKMHLRSSEA